MADIDITCPSCGNEISVSEYVDPVNLKCPNCESPLTLQSERKSEKNAPSVVKGPRIPPPVPQDEVDHAAVHEGGDEESLADTVMNARQHMLSRRKKPKGRIMHTLGAIGLAVVIAGILYCAKYLLSLPADTQKLVDQGGVIFIFALWAAIAMLAFKDDVFQGMLCTLIPGYWIYYLFFQSDSFYVRGLAAGFFAIYGIDFVETLFQFGQGMFQNMDDFISGKNRSV
jgi:predicted RNA-binding Zn-ribbon protein involved in translation (DUF1610 family)